jgi:hypothetical protein
MKTTEGLKKSEKKSVEKKVTKLGKWKIERKDSQSLMVTLPKGMLVLKNNPTIEDLLSAIATSQSITAGRPTARCCSGNMAIV